MLTDREGAVYIALFREEVSGVKGGVPRAPATEGRKKGFPFLSFSHYTPYKLVWQSPVLDLGTPLTPSLASLYHPVLFSEVLFVGLCCGWICAKAKFALEGLLLEKILQEQHFK